MRSDTSNGADRPDGQSADQPERDQVTREQAGRDQAGREQADQAGDKAGGKAGGKAADLDEASPGDRADGPYVAPDDPSKPAKPTDLTKPTWFGTSKRAITQFQSDNCTDWAAALTYYGIQAIFPAVIVLVALVGLVSEGERTVEVIMGLLRELGAGAAVAPLEDPIREVVTARQSAGLALVLGLLGALWSASGYVGAFSRASNAIYEVEEGRPFYKLRPLQVLVTLAALVMAAIVAAGLVVSGPVAEWVGEKLRIGEVAVTAWQFGKWPVLLAIVTVLISLLYWFAPNVQQPKFRWFTAGGAIALFVWIVTSAAFGFYVANFGSYNKTYGSLGAIIGFLVWLYLSNLAMLFGAEVNAELERGRELQAETPMEDTLNLPPRQEKKHKKKTDADA